MDITEIPIDSPLSVLIFDVDGESKSICRTCLSAGDEMESIFSRKLIESDYVQISNMVALCTGVEISEYDSFTSLICKFCIDSIVNAFKYRKKCWKTQQEFLRLAEESYRTKQNLVDCDSIEVPYEMIEVESEICMRNTKKVGKIEIPKSYNDMVDYIYMDASSPDQRLSCALCQSTYGMLHTLRMHLINRHNIQFVTNFQCEICSQYFTHESVLRRHRKTHQPTSASVTCDKCGKQFHKQYALLVHMRRHTGEKPFKCDLCDFRTVQRGDLTIHRRWHTGDRPFKCHICPQTYQTASHLSDHMRKHSDARPYKCEICNTAYKSRKVYKSHMNTHDPAKVVECPECNKIFSAPKYLSKHMKMHRSKIYKCSECEETYTRNQDCRNHMRKVHNRIIGIHAEI